MPQTTLKMPDSLRAMQLRRPTYNSSKGEVLMVCEDDGLSPAQELIYSKHEEQEKAYQKELEAYNQSYGQPEKGKATTAEMTVTARANSQNGGIVGQTPSQPKTKAQLQQKTPAQPPPPPLPTTSIPGTISPIKKTILPGAWQPPSQVVGGQVIASTLPVNRSVVAPQQVVPTIVNAVSPSPRAVIQVPVGTDLTRMQFVSVPNSTYQFVVPSVNLQGLSASVVSKADTRIIQTLPAQGAASTASMLAPTNIIISPPPSGGKAASTKVPVSVAPPPQVALTKEFRLARQPQQVNSTPAGAKRSSGPATTEAEQPKKKRPKVQTENTGESFYGWKQGRSGWEDETPNVSFRCVICNKKLHNNIRYMHHVRHHIEKEQQQVAAAKNYVSCRTCFRQYSCASGLHQHMEKVHKSCQHRCGICETPFPDHLSLMQHLAKIHKPLQMPYVCGVCDYRTSIYDDLVLHFNRLHEGGRSLMCPFCVRIIKCNNAFVRHCKTHMNVSIKNGLFHCRSCKLMFLNGSMLKEHLLQDHKIYQLADRSGIPKWPSAKYEDKPAVTNQVSKSPHPKVKIAPKIKISPSLWTIVKRSGGLRCMECGTVTENCSDHFRMRMACNRCKYTTYCGTAYANHMIVFHKTGSAPKLHRITKTLVGKGRILLGCSSCEFSTLSPTLMACHIECCTFGAHSIESFKVKTGYIHSSKNFRPEIMAVRVHNSEKKPHSEEEEVIVIEEDDLVDLTNDKPGTSKTANTPTSQTKEVDPATERKGLPQVKLERSQTDSLPLSDADVENRDPLSASLTEEMEVDEPVGDPTDNKASENTTQDHLTKITALSHKSDISEAEENDSHKSLDSDSKTPEDNSTTSLNKDDEVTVKLEPGGDT